MATKFSSAVHMSNTAAADFRLWVQFLDDLLLVTGGWTNTADTGQLTISTAGAPTGAQQKVGYRIYAMADTLQGTAPVFMRIDYGSSNLLAIPALWITLGTGSNGTGTITGIFFNGGAVTAETISGNTSGTNACDSYGSADTNRVQALLFVRAGANDLLCFSIERTKDSSGNDTGAGLLFTYQSGSGSGNTDGVDQTQYLALSGAQPPAEVGVSLVLPNEASSAFGSDVGVGIPIHFKSVAQPVAMGVIAVNSGDFAAEAPVSFSIYAAVHTYQLGNSATSQLAIATGGGAKTARASTRVGIRYE